MELWTALIIGFGGSFHCIGMCGPIALALPVSGAGKIQFISGRILYNFGRIISYILMGALFGYLGGKVIMYGLQRILSISLGLIILLFLLIPPGKRMYLASFPAVKMRIIILKDLMRKLFSVNSKLSLLFIGILNGFLPCGFVYVGLAQASMAGDYLNGSLVMLMFGLGTFPVMTAVSFLGKLISLNFRRKLTRTLPYMAGILAIIFILRGLNLGIPYLSPKLEGGLYHHTMMHCH